MYRVISKLSVILGASMTLDVLAMPAQCLQAPERLTVCPHLIYKKAAVSVPELAINKGQVICLCLTDLQALQNKSKTRLERIDQEVTLERIVRKYKLSEDEIKMLVNQ